MRKEIITNLHNADVIWTKYYGIEAYFLYNHTTQERMYEDRDFRTLGEVFDVLGV